MMYLVSGVRLKGESEWCKVTCMVVNREAVAVLPSGQAGLTAQARKRIRQTANRKKSVKGKQYVLDQQKAHS